MDTSGFRARKTSSSEKGSFPITIIRTYDSRLLSFIPFPPPLRNFSPLAFHDGGFLEEIVHRTCAPPTLVNLGYDPPLAFTIVGKIHPLATSISEETRAAARENSRENNDYSLERLALPPDVSE